MPLRGPALRRALASTPPLPVKGRKRCCAGETRAGATSFALRPLTASLQRDAKAPLRRRQATASPYRARQTPTPRTDGDLP